MDSSLSSGKLHPPSEQLGPGHQLKKANWAVAICPLFIIHCHLTHPTHEQMHDTNGGLSTRTKSQMYKHRVAWHFSTIMDSVFPAVRPNRPKNITFEDCRRQRKVFSASSQHDAARQTIKIDNVPLLESEITENSSQQTTSVIPNRKTLSPQNAKNRQSTKSTLGKNSCYGAVNPRADTERNHTKVDGVPLLLTWFLIIKFMYIFTFATKWQLFICNEKPLSIGSISNQSLQNGNNTNAKYKKRGKNCRQTANKQCVLIKVYKLLWSFQ